MPKAKKTTSKNIASKIEIKIKDDETNFVPNLAIADNLPKVKKTIYKYWWLILIVLLLVSVAYYKKGWFVAASVNGKPITNIALQKQLNDTYKTQILNQLIDQQIIFDEAQKNNVIVTEDDINNKIKSIETNVGGPQALDTLLEQSGQTRQTLIDRIKFQSTVEKLYANESSVSASEIDAFIVQNKGQMQSTDSAAQRKEAQDTITQQKLGQIYNQKFPELKQQANIKIY